MANIEIELNPVDFITIGTVGPKGRRLFHLQAGRNSQLVSLTVEKEQTRALSEAITELLDDLAEGSWREMEVALYGEASGSADCLHF